MCALMTPSDTPTGRAVYPYLKRLPLVFSLTPSPSPAKRPSLTTLFEREHLDILGELVEAGVPMVAREILSYLTLEDLAR